jgi:hypothetical protein
MENYEVLKPIGKGKFAIVYRAKRKADDELGKWSWPRAPLWRCLMFVSLSPRSGCSVAVALKKISIDMMDTKSREKCLKEVSSLGAHRQWRPCLKAETWAGEASPSAGAPKHHQVSGLVPGWNGAGDCGGVGGRRGPEAPAPKGAGGGSGLAATAFAGIGRAT